ncbi:MAG: leucine-rich repeat domain-containing protein [Candidatus Korarchaeota archaeon]|nr:leucine-rich repeat domain-containing protein [Candidatus Korarchaeota archaeon]NIU85121.1 hypothetical protein [Candidatus Thorarchaeota archaeon]NIW15085.1 hypothetical protein [Candidatus Thorarchaeota archaeon]NIW53095.1 hypothetical protein [Candidatus Korarchaeota archaeon]
MKNQEKEKEITDKSEVEKIADDLLNTIEINDIKDNQKENEVVEYKGQRIPQKEFEALKAIEEQIGKPPKFVTENMKTTILDLGDTELTDLKPLTHLKHLKQLLLHKTKISDLSPLSTLKNLKQLNLNFSNISDLSPLTKMNCLDTVFLWGTNVDRNSEVVKRLQEKGRVVII